ncbi:patatin-like phospholipase family protein [Legionella hackeliae]|uniref:Putative patatin-like phospholipase n=1 Tax=Legionella hackeliae TaxID=449 RepID=A0A0A8USJ2_LEGHA|nr:patatin-like phospholipase family protein [Legionella hackeliae]KTD10238.1 patatin-like phospholipase [Legionella hackeliae]CEK09734.1 putative patatin-like phospholipase [Legionella hackeliae]STX49644.1 patatin-like phospholipase [Legionella hackeliae]
MAERTSGKKKPAHKKALGLINKPEKTTNAKQTYDRIACVFQGGGALGAYQVGAFRAIHERGYHPNFLAGVSIGAINSAIIAGNSRENQIDKLFEFWDTIAPKLWLDLHTHSQAPGDILDWTHHLHNRFGALYSVFFGLEGFFKPRMMPPGPFTHDTPDKLSYYDTTELRSTLERLIDFDRINDKKVTLCLGAVNITTGEMEFFNNQMITLTVDHVMASGALPPGFPAIKIGDDYYWDGGIYANTPLVTVLDALPELDTLCFVVDCFSLQGPLPHDMDQLEERQKDIRYASHSRRLTNVYTSRQNLQAAINYLGNKLPPDVKSDPEVQKILELGHEKRFSVVHIIYNGTPYSHSFKDYNFIRSAINVRLNTGYKNAIDVLNKPEWEKKSDKKLACSIYGVTSDYFEQH